MVMEKEQFQEVQNCLFNFKMMKPNISLVFQDIWHGLHIKELQMVDLVLRMLILKKEKLHLTLELGLTVNKESLKLNLP